MITENHIRLWEKEFKDSIKNGPVKYTRLSWLAYKFDEHWKYIRCDFCIKQKGKLKK